MSLADTTGSGKGIDVTSPNPDFGGLSGLEVLDGGQEFMAISDYGMLFHGRFQHDAGGLTGVTVTASDVMKRPANARDGRPDTEGLALMPGGGYAVSLEGGQGLWLYDATGQVRHIPRPPGSETLGPNGEYEALASDAQGRLYTLPEQPVGRRTPFPLWRHDANGWTLLRHVPRSDGFLPVGADMGPDGKLYLLERAFGLGFRNRVLRLDPEQQGAPVELVWQGDDTPRTNFEGLATWRRGDGTIMLSLVSDNNFLGVLKTSFLEIPLATQAPSR